MSEQKFEAWAIVDLFGHTRVAGLVTEQTVGGCSFVRVDIPEGDSYRTELYGQGAIYAIRFVSEQVARLAAEQITAAPVKAWDLPDSVRTAMLEHSDGDED